MNDKYNSNSKAQQSVFNCYGKDYFNKSIQLFLDNVDLNGKSDEIGNQKNRVVRVLDVGSAHGKNSNLVVRNLLEQFKVKFEDGSNLLPDFEILHNDLPNNNWRLLFEELVDHNNPTNYSSLLPPHQISIYAIGKSMYNQVVPKGSIDFTMMMNTAHWASKRYHLPINSESFIMLDRKSSSEYISMKINDLTNNLTFRLNELKSNGILITNIFSTDLPDYSYTMKKIWKEFIIENKSLGITNEMLDQVSFPVHVYNENEVSLVISNLKEKFNIQIHANQLVETECLLSPLIESHGLDVFAEKFSQFANSPSEFIIKSLLSCTNEIYDEYLTRFKQHIKLNHQIHKATISSFIIIIEKH